jgi:hypothetical protein
VFGPSGEPAIERARQTVWQSFMQHPPEVFIVGRKLLPEAPDSYDKLDRRPELNEYIEKNCTLYNERAFAPALCGHRGYRIYVRRADANGAPEPVPQLRAAVNGAENGPMSNREPGSGRTHAPC